MDGAWDVVARGGPFDGLAPTVFARGAVFFFVVFLFGAGGRELAAMTRMLSDRFQIFAPSIDGTSI
jgi:hypothetical protein